MKDLMFSKGLKNNPFYFLEDVERDMQRMFDLFPMKEESMGKSLSPLYDMEEGDSHYVLSVDLPGVKKDDIAVELKEGALHISGKREEKIRTGDDTQRISKHFARTIPLPRGVKEDQIKAHYENGVLSLALPKTEKAKTKEIAIEEGKKEGIWANLLEKGQEDRAKNSKMSEEISTQTA